MALTDNLQAYYKFDENTGTSVGDSSGNSNTGTFSGTSTHWTTGKINSGGNFLKANSDIVTLTSRPTTVVDNFTMAGWINPVLAIQTSCIFFNGDGSNGWGIFTGDAFDGTGSKLVGLYQGVAWLDPSITLTNGVWQHVAMIRRSGTAYFYLNGAETNTGATNTPNAPTTGAHFGTDSGTGRFYSGVIDEFGIWDRALTAAEIGLLYNSGYGLTSPFIKNAEGRPGNSGRYITVGNGMSTSGVAN